MNFESFFAPALSPLKTMQGTVSATYTPDGGAPVAITGFWQSREEGRQEYDDGQSARTTGRFVVEQSDVANPAPGEKLAIGGVNYAIREEANSIQDGFDGTWELELISLTPENITAQRKGIVR